MESNELAGGISEECGNAITEEGEGVVLWVLPQGDYQCRSTRVACIVNQCHSCYVCVLAC